MGDSSPLSKRVFFARQALCLGESKRDGKGVENNLFLAQLDLKKAFDHVQHSFATTAPQLKGVPKQLLSVLNKWWTQSDVRSQLGITSDKRISFQRGLPQGAPGVACNICGCF